MGEKGWKRETERERKNPSLLMVWMQGRKQWHTGNSKESRITANTHKKRKETTTTKASGICTVCKTPSGRRQSQVILNIIRTSTISYYSKYIHLIIISLAFWPAEDTQLKKKKKRWLKIGKLCK